MDRYCRWLESGYLSSTGSCFDVGRTVASALDLFQKTGEPFSGSDDPRSAGNGSIMRLAPIPLFFFPDLATIGDYAAQSSRTTHAAEECVDACRLFGRIIGRAVLGHAKEAVAYGDGESFSGAASIVAIARGAYETKSEDAVRGTGYVVESLEAALWCFMKSDSFEAAILKATNLGDDADTTAAVCGQVAGAYYGASQIPAEWLQMLAMRSDITELADQLWRRAFDSGATKGILPAQS